MNRGFLYGDGFFETIRVTDGQIPLIFEHIERIEEAIEIYKLIPTFQIDETFIHSLKSSKNELIRINFFRTGGGKYLAENNELAFDYSTEEYSKPFFLPIKLDLDAELKKSPKISGAIKLYPEPKPNVKWLTVKSLSSIYYVLAADFQKKQDIDYLFIQNQDGYVCEELISNLLIKKGDDLIIFPKNNGGINGVTQRYILSNYGFQLKEENLKFDEVFNADAIYSLKGSTGISRIK
jgi:branched-chain amino acid aminotransferase